MMPKILKQCQEDLKSLGDDLRQGKRAVGERLKQRMARRDESADQTRIGWARVLPIAIVVGCCFAIPGAYRGRERDRARNGLLAHMLDLNNFEIAAESGGLQGVSIDDLKVHRARIDRLIGTYQARDFLHIIRSMSGWGVNPTPRLQQISKALEAAESGESSSEQVQQALDAARESLLTLRDDLIRDSRGRRPSSQMTHTARDELERAIYRGLLDFQADVARFQRRMDDLDHSQVLSKHDQVELAKLSVKCCQDGRALLFSLVMWANSAEELAESEFLSRFIRLHGEVTVFDRASYGTRPCVDEARQIPNNAEVPELVLRMVELSSILNPEICVKPAHYADSTWTRYKIAVQLKDDPLSGEAEITEYYRRNGLLPHSDTKHAALGAELH